ncbi:MAG: FAD-binding oxidoreductase [Bacilli bacterium]|jgi:alkyldihydroxyacetonephosphate synthase|nr:FAD-binding oxidoreductase [Bacilli bacterium]
MSKPYKGFEPKWYYGKVPPKSYRSIFKWGDPDFVKVPKESLYKMLKSRFGMTDKDFDHYSESLGLDTVDFQAAPKVLTAEDMAFLESIYGKDYVRTDPYSRLSVAYGKTMYDLLRLRQKKIENVPDAVVYPDAREQIEKTVAYCAKRKIPLYVYGGGSSVTRGVECMKGGLSLDMRLRYNKVLSFNETDQTITVQTGLSGPDLEKWLNDCQKDGHGKRAYTCGHFPQSFEHSSVGGWVVTRGAGQNSTYYGKIEDIVLSQRYATPIGNIVTSHYPREATGPSLNQIMMGSEGTFGVLTEATLRVFRFMPKDRQRFSYMFKDWASAQDAAREMMQSEAGFSSVFRLSDPEETSIMLTLYGVDETPLPRLMRMRGIEVGKCCLFLGFTDGEKGYGRNVAKNIRRIAHAHQAMSLTGLVVKGWEKGRFSDPYMRDSMQDFGIMTDTLECSVNWSNMPQVYKDVRAFCKSRPNTILTTHMSHAYPQGANLYFIFIAKMTSLEEYKKYQDGILNAIQKSGAAMSHHHGIGKSFAPWLEGSMGHLEYSTFLALKKHFDPDGIMNPGGTLGLDLKPEQKIDKNEPLKDFKL